MSDLHTDAAAYELPPTPPDVDVIVIAGDVADGIGLGQKWLRDSGILARGVPVVLALGNHDYYGHDLAENLVSNVDGMGVQVLHARRPAIELAGVRLIGSTLWTDYAIAGDVDLARAWARGSMPDMFSIDLGLRRIGTRDLLDTHKQQRMIIERELALPFAGPSIVVTHHAPHSKSLRSPLLTPDDASYASDLTSVIERHKPVVWIHGHVHQSRDYTVADTRIVCNPRGYAVVNRDGKRVENRDFNPAMVVEV